MKIGSFVCAANDETKESIAIVIFDHSVFGCSKLFSIKWMDDGMMSNRHQDELQELTPLEFCKVWCKNQMGYDGVEEP